MYTKKRYLYIYVVIVAVVAVAVAVCVLFCCFDLSWRDLLLCRLFSSRLFVSFLVHCCFWLFFAALVLSSCSFLLVGFEFVFVFNLFTFVCASAVKTIPRANEWNWTCVTGVIIVNLFNAFVFILLFYFGCWIYVFYFRLVCIWFIHTSPNVICR